MNYALNSIAASKEFPFSKFIKSEILQMMRNGQIHKLKQKWLSKTARLCDSAPRNGRSLSIEKIITIFLLLAFGAISALAIMMVEIFKKRFKGKAGGTEGGQCEARIGEFKNQLCEVLKNLNSDQYPDEKVLNSLQETVTKMKCPKNVC